MKISGMYGLLFLMTLFTLNACDNKHLETEAKVETAINNPLAPQVEALKKAKDLESKLLEDAEKQRKAIDEMTK